MVYLWVKGLHLTFVVIWIATLFYLPHVLIGLVQARGDAGVTTKLCLRGRRLYRFGHNVFGLAFLCGLVLWYLAWRGLHWVEVKLGLVLILIAYFSVIGRMIKRAQKGEALPSAWALRGFYVLPASLLAGIVYLAVFKPF